MMKRLQEKELELLKEFIRVCDILGLKYYLVCGSALGAVKYGGFIPWDDDIDVALLRADYEVFLEKAQKLLPEWIFVQNYRTDKEFPLLMTKLRNNNTTFIEEDFSDIPMNHGVSIDVFPLDGYPNSRIGTWNFERKKKFYLRRQFVKLMDRRGKLGRNIRSTGIWVMYKLFGYCKESSKVLERYEKFLSGYSTEGSRYWCNHANWQGKLEYAEPEQYGEGYMTIFEGISVCIPEKYDKYLRQKYGDYMKELPPDKQVSHHKFTVIDLENSYEKYFSEKKKF